MPPQKKPLVITGWQQGIAPSADEGFENMTGVDIWSSPGVIRPSILPTSATTGNNGQIKWIIPDTQTLGRFFALTNTQKVLRSTDYGATWTDITGGAPSTGTGDGIGYINGRVYIIAVNGATGVVDQYVVSTNTWTPAWQTLSFTTDSTMNQNPSIIGEEGSLYFGIGRYLSKIDSAFNWTEQALDLPETTRIRSLGCLGGRIYLGTRPDTAVVSQESFIYPWDYISPYFDLPIRVPVPDVRFMLTANNTIYFMGGFNLRLYATNGSSVAEVTRIPETLLPTDFSEKTYQIYPQSLAIMNDVLIIAVGSLSGTAADHGKIFLYNLRTGVLTVEAEDQAVASTTCNFLCVCPTSGAHPLKYMVGTDILTGGNYIIFLYDRTANRISTNDYLTSYADTQVFNVGTHLDPRVFERATITFDAPLAAGQGIIVQYRNSRSLIANYTTVNTYNHTTFGAVQTIDTEFSVTTSGSIQFRIYFFSNTSSTAALRLRRIEIW